MEERPWVQDEAGRDGMLGKTLECLFCNVLRVPAFELDDPIAPLVAMKPDDRSAGHPSR